MTSIFLVINTYIIIAFIAAFVMLIYFSISFYVYKMLMINYNKPPINLVDHKEDFYKDSYKWFQEVPKDDVYIKTYDNFRLHGVFIPSYNKKSNNLAIVVHGYQSKATDMIIIGKMYAEMGFQVLLTDLRGHGKSEGTFTSFGYYEKYDLKKWINYACRTYGADTKILIHGVSMGAATTMMVTGLDIPKNVKFLLIDSGFTYVRKTFTNANRSRGLKIFYFGLNVISYLKHKFTFYQIRPIKYMRRNTIPFLIVTGEVDRVVPVSMGTELLNSSPATIKDLLVIEGSKHAQAFRVDYQRCYDRLLKDIKPIFNVKKIYESNME